MKKYKWTVITLVVLVLLSANCTPSATEVSPEPTELPITDTPTPVLNCIDFEDLTSGTRYKVGDVFTASGAKIAVEIFFLTGGTSASDGYAQIGTRGEAGGSGNELQINNVNLRFDFGSPISDLSIFFGELGGNLNLDINGDFQNFGNFADINGATIGGVDIYVVNGFGNDQGRLRFIGTIHSFSIGGQELWIDDVCPKDQITPQRAASIATDFADLVEVDSVAPHWESSTNSHSFEVRGSDSKGDLLIGVDAVTGEVVKFIKQCPYPGRDSETAAISEQEAIQRSMDFLRENELPEIPADYVMEEPRLLTTWTMQHWRIDYLRYVDEIEVAPDFILFLVNAETGEIASYAKVLHPVTVPTRPDLDREEAIDRAREILSEEAMRAYGPDLEFLSVTLKILYPNHYFYDLIYRFSERQALAWVVQFGQGEEPEIDVWIDALTGSLLGGEIYERPIPELYGIGNQATDATVIWEPALDAMQFDTSHTFTGDTTEAAIAQSIQNADYFIFQAHGNTNVSAIVEHTTGADATLLDPSEIPTNNLRYALMSSCRSGVTTSGTDFWEAFVNGGTDVFHGYAEISNPDYYEMALRRYLALGNSLWNAHWNAISDSGYKKTVTIKYGPPLTCFNQLRLAPLLVKTTGLVQGTTITIRAEVKNLEDARKSAATNVRAQLIAPAGFTISGTSPQTTSSLAWNNTWTAQWTVQIPAGASGTRTFDVVVTSDNLGVAVDDFAKATATTPSYHPVMVTLAP